MNVMSTGQQLSAEAIAFVIAIVLLLVCNR